MTPKVSIVILNHNYPENIVMCLYSLAMTKGIAYETVVVDNGSETDSVAILEKFKEEGRLDTLVLIADNHFFSQ